MPTIHDKVKHVIVVMLENRSFNNMLGWLKNPDNMPRSEPASYSLPVDPDHSHEGVMWQLLGKKPTAWPAPTSPITMGGFAAEYEASGGHGVDVLRGFKPEQVPVLSTLAQEFATCTRWFCSVPGQTWPNRNYAHAGTSDGEVNIKIRFYKNPTIFERIHAAGGSWRVYHQGPAQVWCFPALWLEPFHHRFADHADLVDDIRNDRLPNYAFVEPDHGVIFHDTQHSSNSQHPGNNVVDGRDFRAGEMLLHTIYTTLLASPEVWRKTLLIVTYDEHGGFADHVPPPDNAVAPDDNGLNYFGFTLLGPRVPTVLVSPWIRRGADDGQTTYDHSAIPRALRELFAPDSEPLSRREQHAALLLKRLALDEPRADVPTTQPLRVAPTLRAERVSAASTTLAAPPRPLDPFQQSLVELSQLVDNGLRTEAAATRLSRDRFVESVNAAPDAMYPFVTEADRQFYLQDVVRRFQSRHR